MRHVCFNKKGKMVYRGPRPDSHLQIAPNVGYRVDLQSGVFDLIHDTPLEHEDPERYKITVRDFDLGDFLPPSYELVKEIIEYINSRDEAVYIHCLHGKDRTGFICACLQAVNEDLPEDQLVEEMYELGFHKWPYLCWVPSLRRTIRKLKFEYGVKNESETQFTSR